MNKEILKAKIAEVISSTNKSGNEKLEAILAVVDAYSSAGNGAKPIVSRSKCDYHAAFTFCGDNGITYCSNCGDPV